MSYPPPFPPSTYPPPRSPEQWAPHSIPEKQTPEGRRDVYGCGIIIAGSILLFLCSYLLTIVFIHFAPQSTVGPFQP
jgi:hypothetical protein